MLNQLLLFQVHFRVTCNDYSFIFFVFDRLFFNHFRLWFDLIDVRTLSIFGDFGEKHKEGKGRGHRIYRHTDRKSHKCDLYVLFRLSVFGNCFKFTLFMISHSNDIVYCSRHINYDSATEIEKREKERNIRKESRKLVIMLLAHINSLYSMSIHNITTCYMHSKLRRSQTDETK